MASEVIFRGPVFDGRAVTRTQKMCTDIEQAVAHETQQRVRILGQSQFRYADKSHHQVPGKWRSHIHVVTREGHAAVTDSGIIYGPWLEGTGSRNKTTRFKGYGMWRRTFANMDRSGAREIYTPITVKAIAEINA